MPGPTIVWLRQDLRLADNPALHEAADGPVLPVFILDETTPHPPGGASRWWLHHSLKALAQSLAALGSRLLLFRGAPARVLDALIAETGARAVYWNRRYEPAAQACDANIKANLRARGLDVRSFNAALLHEPWAVTTAQNTPYKIFSPFYRACLERPVGACVPAPRRLLAPTAWPEGVTLESLRLLPRRPDWSIGLRETWQPGETTAQRLLSTFLAQRAPEYADARNHPGKAGTSTLSPHLHWGEIGPRQIWHAVMAAEANNALATSGGRAFLRELGWRDFNYSLLHSFPTLPEQPLNPRFASFPWHRDSAYLRAWQKGQTGIPLVDAGMRELWHTGYMHNRVRMVVGSFLVKHLLQPWQDGQSWFWDTLVDADLANNAASWQWIAGCGADAAPYFRVFNPVLQGEKFDTDGIYVRRWVPEIAGLPDKLLHRPWDAPDFVLRQAGIQLGLDYPRPIVDLAVGRNRALAAYKTINGQSENEVMMQMELHGRAGGGRA
jgi:deoxyribodipyrimidine photo-lyase